MTPSGGNALHPSAGRLLWHPFVSGRRAQAYGFYQQWRRQEKTLPSLIRLGSISPDEVEWCILDGFWKLSEGLRKGFRKGFQKGFQGFPKGFQGVSKFLGREAPSASTVIYYTGAIWAWVSCATESPYYNINTLGASSLASGFLKQYFFLEF